MEIKHLYDDHDNTQGTGTTTTETTSLPSPLTSLTRSSPSTTKDFDSVFNLNQFSDYEKTFSLKCLQSAAKPPHVILFNDGLFIRLTSQFSFRFWPIELIWIEMDEKLSDSEFELRTPEGFYKLVSSLWHAVLLKTIKSVCSNRGDLFVSRNGSISPQDNTVESNSIRERRCCLYHLFRSGPLESFAYYGSWLNGRLDGSGKMCWPAKNLHSLHSCKQSTHSTETSSLICHPQNNYNDDNDYSAGQLPQLPDSVRLFLSLIGPLDIGVKNIENEVISIFCTGEFQSNQLNGLGELCIQTVQGSINVRAEWKNGRPHGIGSLRCINGDIYTGWFVNGTREGHGCQETFPLTTTNSNNQQSEAKCAKRHRKTSDWSTLYLGNWLADKQEGFGIQKDITTSDVYAGQWMKGAMYGRGIMYQSSGVCVAGEFQANGINGQGLCITPEGNIYTGMLSKNHPKGKAILNILSSNLLLVGNFSGALTSSPSKDNNTLYFKGSIIPVDGTMNNNNNNKRITSGSYHHRLRVPFLVQEREKSGAWKQCERIETVINELSSQGFESSVNSTHCNQSVDTKTLANHDFIELAILISSYTVPFHLRWDSLFRNCVINAMHLFNSTSLSCLTDYVNSLTSRASLDNASNASSNDVVSPQTNKYHQHIQLINELANWCLPTSLGGLAVNSIDELLCNMLNELDSHEMHTVQPVLKIPTSSPLWLKYLRLISSLLADCFHITCTINYKQLSCHRQSTEVDQLFNSPYPNYSIHTQLVLALSEYAHLVARLAHTFAQAIQQKLNSLAFTPVLQIDNVNHLFQVCEPNVSCDLFTLPNLLHIDMVSRDDNVDASGGRFSVSDIDDCCQCNENEKEEIEAGEEEGGGGEESVSIKGKWHSLCSLPEVQLSGSISLFELACDCLLPNIYPTLFGLFKAQYAMLDKSYWVYRQALHCKSDFVLYSYLELDKNLWLWHTPSVSNISTTPLSEQFSAFHPAVDILRTICDKTTPTEKLLIIYQAFATVDQIISKSKPCRNHVRTSLDEMGNCRNPSICSVDTLSHLPGLDQLLPIIQFVVIRAGVMYLGAELAYIEQLAPERLSLTGLLPYLMTTLQACYDQILREGLQFTIQF
ncbi:unnamed protein product [Trichobilharzia szidati]|nr:unnamed protein product [Trichobilharzia szidati]